MFGGVTRGQHTRTAIDSAKSQTHSAKPAVFGVFSPNGSALWRPHPLNSRLRRHQTGGNCIIRAATRRRYPASQLLMLQIPHHSQPEMRRAASKTWAQHRLARKNSPSTALPPAFPRKTSPSTLQTTDFRPFFVRWANFFALTPTIRPSRANFFAHRTPPAATMQPMTPPQPLMQASMKPPSPLRAPE